MIPKKFQTFQHPKVDSEIERSVIKQLHEAISIYDNKGIYSEIESKLKEIFPVKHLLTVCNGTSALLSMYFGAGIQPGDIILVPAYTFFATATPLFLLGAIPILIDAGIDGNISVEDLKRNITNDVKAVVITHMWGIPCDLDSISKICKERGILLLEDCSHAHGATFNGKVVGTDFSNAAAFSLQGKKLLTSGEGGFVATNSQEIFERAILLGHFNKRAKLDVSLDFFKEFCVTGVGGNLRMHPLGAAILRPQLNQFDKQLLERRETAKILREEIENIKGLSNIVYPHNSNPAWYAFPFIVDENYFSISVHELVDYLVSLGAVESDIPGSTRPLADYPLFIEPWKFYPSYSKYREILSQNKRKFPGAYAFHSRMIKFPTWYGQDRYKYVNYYLDALRSTVKKYKR